MKLRLPRSRRTWAVLFLLIAVCTVGGHYALRWYTYERGERELQAAIAELDAAEPGWRAADILAARPKIPDAENGALVLERLMPTWGQNFSLNPSGAVRNAMLGKIGLASLEEAFQPYESSLDALRSLHRLPNGRFDWQGGNPPDVFHLLDMGKLLAADSSRQSLKGDAEKAGQSLAALAHMACYLDAEPTIMGRMVGSAQLVVLQTAWIDAVGRAELPAAHSERVAAALARRRQGSLKQAFRMERASHKELFEQFDPDSPNALPSLMRRPSMFARAREQYQIRARAPHLHAAEAEFLRRTTRVISAMDLPAADREAAVAGIADDPWPAAMVVNPIESMGKYITDDEHASMQLLIFEAAVQSELFRHRTGDWPRKIEDLAGSMPLSTEFGEPLEISTAVSKRERNGRIVYFPYVKILSHEASRLRANSTIPLTVMSSKPVGPPE